MLDWQTLRGARPEDHVVDFSFAGCFKNERPLPSPYIQAGPNVEILHSTYDERDRTGDIFQSLERLSRRGGGVLQLSGGPFCLAGSAALHVKSSRTTIQGDASGQQPTVLIIAGVNRPVFAIGPQEPQKPKFDLRANILDAYVPAGAQALRVDKPQHFTRGLDVVIERQASPEWISALQMDKLSRNGKPQTWMKPNTRLHDFRTVKAVEQGVVWLDAPLTDSIDKKLMPNATMSRFTPPADAVCEVGLSHLSFRLSPSQCGSVVHAQEGVMQGIVIHPFSKDCWIRNCDFTGFATSVTVQGKARQITVQDCKAIRDAPTDKGSGYPADFSISGDLVLLFRCATVGSKGTDSISPAIQSRANLIAVVGHKSTHSYIQTHQRWATGILVDGSDCKDIELVDRGNKGSGQGLSASNCVVWNSRGWRRVRVDRTPLSMNFAIGCVGDGQKAPSTGQEISAGTHVQPMGLFAQQLSQRLGREAASSVLNMQL